MTDLSASNQPNVSDDGVLEAVNVTKRFGQRSRFAWRKGNDEVWAVRDVSIRVEPGETVGVIGESGSGKSTLARILCGLIPATSGAVRFGAMGIDGGRDRRNLAFRRQVQMVFQDPYGSLDPTKSVGNAIAEPLLVHQLMNRREAEDAAAELAQRVALNPDMIRRFPDQLSGGQRQRVAIARALALEPRVLIADEPTSALDLSTRSEILNLLLSLQEEDGLSILLVSHDFATIEHLSHRIVVMYQGSVVEEGPAEKISSDPDHEYTAALLDAVPIPDPTNRHIVKQHLHQSGLGAGAASISGGSAL